MPSLWRALDWLKDTRWTLALIAVINLGGIAYGFYYYAQQFATTPAWLWIFVPDSPFAVLWAEIAVLLWFARKRSDFVDAMAFVANAQVGTWTAFVLFRFADEFRLYEYGLNFVLFWLHLGMVALALLFVPGLRRAFAGRPRRWAAVVGVVLAWQLLNWWLDYYAFDFYGTGCSIRPYTVPCDPVTEPTVAAVTLGLLLVSVGAMAWLTRPRAPASLSGPGPGTGPRST